MHEGADSQEPRLKVGNSSSFFFFSFYLTEIKEIHAAGCNLVAAVLLLGETIESARQHAAMEGGLRT